MKLNPYVEIVGTLVDICFKEDTIILLFSFPKEIEIPSDAILEQKLKSALGKRIGIFNLNGEYKMREIREKSLV